MIEEIEQEVLLVKKIDLIATKVKETKDNVSSIDALNVSIWKNFPLFYFSLIPLF